MKFDKSSLLVEPQLYGVLPPHWSAKRLKYVSSINDEALPETTDPGFEFLYVDIGSVDATEGIRNKEPMVFETAPSRARRIVRDGDTILSTVRTYLRAVASIDRPEDNLIVSTGFAVVRPRDINAKFLGYCLRSSYFIETVVSRSVGVSYPATNPSDISCIEVPLPSLEEQQAIACFLDAKTAQIDTLIAKKRELIAKLKEKRSALIARTVTRGLPPEAAKAAGLAPNPRMKDSGVPWIGDMPVGWKVKRLKHISDRITVGVVVNPSSYVSDEGVPFLLGGDIREFKIDTTNCNHCPEEASNGPLVKSRLVAEDLVVVRVGYPGVAAVIPAEIEGANCASMMIVGRSDRFHSQWLAYAFNAKSGRDQVELVQYGAAQKQFNISHAVDFSFPFPPIAEQRGIAAYLDRECERLEKFIEKVETAITRLTEYRQALITSAVTGKIDVREHELVKEAA